MYKYINNLWCHMLGINSVRYLEPTIASSNKSFLFSMSLCIPQISLNFLKSETILYMALHYSVPWLTWWYMATIFYNYRLWIFGADASLFFHISSFHVDPSHLACAVLIFSRVILLVSWSVYNWYSILNYWYGVIGTEQWFTSIS